jgi:hypothetical protein
LPTKAELEKKLAELELAIENERHNFNRDINEVCDYNTRLSQVISEQMDHIRDLTWAMTLEKLECTLLWATMLVISARSIPEGGSLLSYVGLGLSVLGTIMGTYQLLQSWRRAKDAKEVAAQMHDTIDA